MKKWIVGLLAVITLATGAAVAVSPAGAEDDSDSINRAAALVIGGATGSLVDI